MPKRDWPTRRARGSDSEASCEGNPWQSLWGRGRYVPTRARFGKAHESPFADFITGQNPAKSRVAAPKRHPPGGSCQRWRKSPASRLREPQGNVMDQSLKSPGQSALDDAFHAMFELSRTTPEPSLDERLDRLARLRAVVADNEARFEAAISADFGHRSNTETLIAETMFVLGEIRHTTKHLKKWMAPRRISTALQFMPAKNRLMPQPLGVVGIIAPWNYPLQLTLAPAV